MSGSRDERLRETRKVRASIGSTSTRTLSMQNKITRVVFSAGDLRCRFPANKSSPLYSQVS